jgi:hypothetical protein
MTEIEVTWDEMAARAIADLKYVVTSDELAKQIAKALADARLFEKRHAQEEMEKCKAEVRADERERCAEVCLEVAQKIDAETSYGPFADVLQAARDHQRLGAIRCMDRIRAAAAPASERREAQ